MLEIRKKKTIGHKARLFLRAFLLILLVLLFFSSRMKPQEGENSLLTFTQYLLYPFQYSFHQTKDFVTAQTNHYLHLVSVAKENTQLKEENFLLRAKLLTFKQLSSEIHELEELLDFTKELEPQTFALAKVMGSFNHPISQGLRISSGTEKGLKVGMPVISPQGVLGKIVRTSYGFSDVLLASDSHFVLDVLLERTRTRSLLKGDSHSSCLLEVHKQTDLKVGDTLVTSGLLGIFPKGIPAGIVTDIFIDTDETIKTARVELWANGQTFDSVIVIKNTPFEEKSSQEPAKKLKTS